MDHGSRSPSGAVGFKWPGSVWRRSGLRLSCADPGIHVKDNSGSIGLPVSFDSASGTKDQGCEFWLRLLPQSYTWHLRPRSKAGAVFL